MDSNSPLLGYNYNNSLNPKRSLSYVLLLTVIVGGLQLSYSAEFANGSPFLLGLGMTKSLMALIWIAGPISGSICQPIVGILSDETRLSIGRRRPFIITGAIATITSLLLLSWSRDIMGLFTSTKVDKKTIPFAIICVYILDFSIQVIQAATRAFIVDNVPTHQQQIANAWAARMIGIGNIVAYAFGSLDLPRKFGWLGNTQFKCLSAIACIALVVTVVPACIRIHEVDPNTDPTLKQIDNNDEEKLTQKLNRIWNDTVIAIKNLSPQTRLICNIQFFAWIGIFPVLYYTTTFVGEIYVQQTLNQRLSHDLPPLTKEERSQLENDGTRKGTQALLIYSISSLIFNFILPSITQENYQHTSSSSSNSSSNWFKIPGLTVKRVWCLAHGLYFLLTVFTFWIKTVSQATIFVGLLGFTWAVSQWAPFTLISQEISRIKEKKAIANNTHSSAGQSRQFMNYEHQAGVVLGVMNVFVSLPQVFASLCSSIIFKLTDSADNGGNSIGWVFRFGGLSALVAIYLTFFIKSPKELDRDDEFARDEE